MNTTTLVLLIVGSLLLTATLITGFVLMVIRLSAKLLGDTTCGRLSQLVERYGTTGMPSGETLTRQTVQIGPVLYQRCVDVAVEETGLYLRRGQRQLLIPWAEIHGLQWVRLYWQETPCLVIGQPASATITIPREVLQQIQRKHPNLECLRGLHSVHQSARSAPESVTHG